MTTDREERIGWAFPAIVFSFVIIAWVATWLALHEDPARGTFGDMFGVINALFSGLAFGGVIFAILLQKKELSLQRKELELTRGELKGQKEQMEAQNATLRKQNFETTFFQLLRLHSEITNDIDVLNENRMPSKGRDCFSVFYRKLRKEWNRAVPVHQENELDRINETYLKFYGRFQSEFGHYFRNLYNIIKLIDNSEVGNKRLYTNLVRAQLSSFELALLFYNALSDMGSEKFKPLIEKYSLLKTLPQNELIDMNTHLTFYDRSAYGK